MEHIGGIGVLLLSGPPQLHRVKAGVGGCELLQRAVQLMQEKPGRVGVYFRQVEEDTVEREWHQWGDGGEEEGGQATAHPRGCYWALSEKELITVSSHFKEQREPT